jgi:hypothetical protein
VRVIRIAQCPDRIKRGGLRKFYEWISDAWAKIGVTIRVEDLAYDPVTPRQELPYGHVFTGPDGDWAFWEFMWRGDVLYQRQAYALGAPSYYRESPFRFLSHYDRKDEAHPLLCACGCDKFLCYYGSFGLEGKCAECGKEYTLYEE